MKTYTDLEQSKKLFELLSDKNADLFYLTKGYRGADYFEKPSVIDGNTLDETDVPCWSLAALLSFLPWPYIEQNFMGKWTCKVEQRDTTFLREASNPIDACYEMILALKEKNII